MARPTTKTEPDAAEVPEVRPILEALRAKPEKIGLQAKLTSVLSDVRRIPKRGRNEAQKYDFAREGDIADMIRDSLAAHRIAFSAAFRVRETGDLSVIYNVIQSRSGGAGVECIVDVDITLTCGDTGETQTVPWQGVATDYTDKALMKALTAAKKSYLVFTFLVSTGDEEADATGIERAGQQRQQQAQQQGSHAHGQAAPTAEQIKAGRNADGSPDNRKASNPQKARLFALARESAFLAKQTEKGRKVDDTALHNLVAWVTRKPELDPAGPVTSLTELTKYQMARCYAVIEQTNADPEVAGQVAAAIDEWLQGDQTAEAASGEESQAKPTADPAADTADRTAGADENADEADEPADDDTPVRNPGSSEHDASIPFGDDDTPAKEDASDEGD